MSFVSAVAVSLQCHRVGPRSESITQPRATGRYSDKDYNGKCIGGLDDGNTKRTLRVSFKLSAPSSRLRLPPQNPGHTDSIGRINQYPHPHPPRAPHRCRDPLFLTNRAYAVRHLPHPPPFCFVRLECRVDGVVCARGVSPPLARFRSRW